MPKNWTVCRIHSPYGERWAVHKDYSCEYLDKYGQWNIPACVKAFTSAKEAESFAIAQAEYNTAIHLGAQA